MLEVCEISKHFGGLKAVNNMDLRVKKGEIVGLVGTNGSGKSTLLNLIAGTLRPTKGKVVFKGEDITGLIPSRRAEKGIARVFQRNILFHSFTVLENVMAGLQLRHKKTLPEVFFSKKQDKIEHEKAMAIIESLELTTYLNETAVNLPHGKQRVLCLAVAMATEPELILLDEPLTGMNAEEMEHILQLIVRLNEEEGITCILVEHNFKAITQVCHYATVMNQGKKIAEGLCSHIVEMPEVIETYLGVMN